LRSTVSSSRLVRLLAEGLPEDAPPSGMDFAERVSLWLNAFDAINLQSAHQAVRAIASAAPKQAAPARGRTRDVAEDFRQVRAVLAQAIALDPVALDAHVDDGGFGPYRRRQQDLQRQMEQMVGALRDHVRQVLARTSVRLRQLATLDAAMEQLLARREQALLPGAPALLERRFAAARAQDAEWRTAYAPQWRQLLLAELELRLEPVAGLIDALDKERNDRR
jgi:hypothetical protein